MNSTIRVASAHDLLALIPVLAGYRPERSLVCVAFREDRIVGVLRYDLPRRADERGPLADAAVGVLCRIPDADGLVVVTYSDARYRSRSVGGDRALLRVLMQRARRAGFAIRDAFRVAGDGWDSVLEDDAPEGGHPLELIEASSVLHHPAIADAAPGVIDACAALPEVSAHERERIRTALLVLDAEYGPAPRADAPGVERARPRGTEAARLPDPIELVESLLSRPPAREPTDDDVVRLAWLARLAAIPVCRDAMMLQVAFGPAAGHAALAWSDVEPDDGFDAHDGCGDACVAHDSVGRMLLGETAERPDSTRVERGVAVVLRAAASAPAQEGAGLLCMAAWLAWGLGRGSAAATLLERSLEADPTHAMAQLFARYFATGAIPEWAFHPGPAGRAQRVSGERRAPR